MQTKVPDQQKPDNSVTNKSDHLVEIPTVNQSNDSLMEDPLLHTSETSAFNTWLDNRCSPFLGGRSVVYVYVLPTDL